MVVRCRCSDYLSPIDDGDGGGVVLVAKPPFHAYHVLLPKAYQGDVQQHNYLPLDHVEHIHVHNHGCDPLKQAWMPH